jgi:hypothetical protein
MTPKENCNENLRKSISGIFGKKFMGTHCNALNKSNEEVINRGKIDFIKKTTF